MRISSAFKVLKVGQKEESSSIPKCLNHAESWKQWLVSVVTKWAQIGNILSLAHLH